MAKRNDELEFLPATLEIQESPPSPAGRMVVWTIMALTVGAILWACLGQVDVVVTAQGKIIPSDRVKTVQPLELGVIREIHVAEGQRVRSGERLIDLDPTAARADAERLRGERDSTAEDIARLQQLAAIDDFASDRGASLLRKASLPESGLISSQNSLLDSQVEEIRASLATLKRQWERRAAELRTLQIRRKNLQQILPIVEKRTASVEGLAKANLAPQQEYLELEQQRIETVGQLEETEQQIVEAEAAMREIEQQQDAVVAEHRRGIYEQLVDAQRRLASLDKELEKAEQRQRLMTLTAPVGGVVQQLVVSTIGGVVSPAQELMKIVPEEGALEVEAFIQNKDIGFVQVGQSVEIKLEAFSFTKYGTIDGELLHISQDAIEDERLGLIYSARIRLAESSMDTGERLVSLAPGMAVTAEVKTGKRRIVEYFLSPLQAHVRESGRER